jgi:hypothetical protein
MDNWDIFLKIKTKIANAANCPKWGIFTLFHQVHNKDRQTYC